MSGGFRACLRFHPARGERSRAAILGIRTQPGESIFAMHPIAIRDFLDSPEPFSLRPQETSPQ